MEPATATDTTATVTVENIGGIASAAVALRPGVTVLAGRNATNRTSFLKALIAVHGSDWTSVKADAERGQVRLELGETTYERTVTRTERGVVGSGDQVLADPAVADLFAFLLEDNEARQAGMRGDDLREIIMRPIDTEELRAEIRDAERRKDEIDDQLDRIASLKRELPGLEQQRDDLRAQIREKRSALSAVEDRISDRDISVDRTQSNTEQLETKLDELQATRAELRRVRERIQTEQESISALRDERGQLAADRAGLPDASEERLGDIEDRLAELRDRKRELATYTTRLQNVIGFNEELLDGQHTEITEAIKTTPETVGDVTEQLYTGSKTTCWTCGSKVTLEHIETTLDTLRDHRQETLSKSDSIQADIDEVSEEREQLRDALDRRRELADTLDDVDAEIDRRQSTLTDLRSRRENLSERVEQLEAEVTDLRTAEVDELLDLHSEANELEFELDQLESELDELNQKTDDIESEIRRDEELVTRREAVVDELIDLRTRIDSLESDATTQFNDRMAELLETLEYDNLERIWLERTDGPDESVATVQADSVIEGSEFKLHVVRSSDNGTVYEDSVDHLSESEREVTGLVFALAGYLVHDVHEVVPFMLLDSLEAIDADRIAALVRYFSGYVPYLVVALLPEDAQALPDGYDRVTDIG